MSNLDEALNQYGDAGDKFASVAARELSERALARYPTAATARVTAILTEDYTEHRIEILDAEGNRLNGNDDWPEDDPELGQDWFINVTEGICVFNDHEKVDLRTPPREPSANDPDRQRLLLALSVENELSTTDVAHWVSLAMHESDRDTDVTVWTPEEFALTIEDLDVADTDRDLFAYLRERLNPPATDPAVYTITRSDLDHLAGREVTDEEADRLSDAIGNSSIPEALAVVVEAVCGLPEES